MKSLFGSNRSVNIPEICSYGQRPFSPPRFCLHNSIVTIKSGENFLRFCTSFLKRVFKGHGIILYIRKAHEISWTLHNADTRVYLTLAFRGRQTTISNSLDSADSANHFDFIDCSSASPTILKYPALPVISEKCSASSYTDRPPFAAFEFDHT